MTFFSTMRVVCELLLILVVIWAVEGYPQGPPNCPVLGKWRSEEDDRTVEVTEVPSILSYIHLNSTTKYRVTYISSWDVHEGILTSEAQATHLVTEVPSVFS